MSARKLTRTDIPPPAVLASSKTVLDLVDAIRRGEVDALVLPTPKGERVFTQWSAEQPYRVLIEAMSEGAITVSADGTVVYCNAAFARMLGSSLEKVIGSNLWEIVVPGDAEKLASLLAQGRRTPARAELTLCCSRGRTVPAYISLQPLPGGDGSRLCAVVTDLTDLDVARQAQLRLAAIVETSADAILSISLDGLVTSWNRGAEQLLGFPASDILGRSLLNTIPVDRCGDFLGLLERVRLGNSTENTELQQLRRDGGRIDVILTLSPIRDRQGNVVAASMIARDNTSRKRAHQRLQSVLESAPDAIVVADHNGNIQLVNTQTEILFGYRRQELIGRSMGLLMPRSNSQFFSKWYQLDPLQRMPGSRSEVTGLRADGSEFPAEISLGAVESEEGTLLCTAMRDISERYAFQHALREKNVQLQAALSAKERFLATMSHELRTPLTAIIGFVGILLMKISGPLNDAQVRQMESVRSSARHLLAIINDLLDLARIEAGQAQLHRESVVCREVIEETVREFVTVAAQKDVSLIVSIPDDTVALQTDRRFLRQILANLIGNAVKFTDKGSVRIAVHHDETTRDISIVVTDTGIGILPEDLSRLFVEFCRVQSRSGDHREGTGLGLHLSQQLALLLGGRITVASDFGRGSTFTLTLKSE